MTSKIIDDTNTREDEGGGNVINLMNIIKQKEERNLNINNEQQSVDIFVKHVGQQLKMEQDNKIRRSSLPIDVIELPTLNGVVMRRKQQLQLHNEQQSNNNNNNNNSSINNQESTPTKSIINNLTTIARTTSTTTTVTTNKGRPLSICSISSAASSGSSSSANSSASSGVQSSLTRNGSLNYGLELRRSAYLASIESLNNQQLNLSQTNENHNSNSSQSIEQALKGLNLSQSSCQYRDVSAATRAAVLAAGAQSRGFNINSTSVTTTTTSNNTTTTSINSSETSSQNNSSSLISSPILNGNRISQIINNHQQQQQQHHNLRTKRGSVKLQPSPSSASSHSNSSSLFRDDGFEDDLTTNNLPNEHLPKSPGYWDSNLSITQRVVTEIIETERNYVDDLEQIVTGYICYLRNILKQQKQKQNYIDKKIDKNCRKLTINQSKTINSSHTEQNDNNDNVENNNNVIEFENETINTENEIDDEDDDDVDDDHDDDDDDDDIEDVDLSLLKGNVSSQNNCENNSYHDNCNTLVNSMHEVRQSKNNENDNSKPIIKNNKTTILPFKKTGIINDNDNKHNSYSNNDNGIIITVDHLEKLFSNLEDIYKFNKDLLFRLEECYLNPSSVAECFVENSSGFDVYTNYCTMYPEVVKTLTELMASEKSAQLLKERQIELKQSLPLGAYLLKPVQRILKYHILFQSLIKYTSDDNSIKEKDRLLINEAFSVMTSIACHINEMKKRHEHAIRVQEVQGLLSGWNDGPDLTTLGELILEDTFKLFNRPKSSRHLFLFDNVLLFTKKKRDGILCYKGHIACSNLMLIEKIDGQPLVFNTVPFDNPKALYSFQARNLDKKRDWCLQMKEVIIKSFEVKIPNHVKDILMNLTNSGCSETESASSSSSLNTTMKLTSENARLMKAPNYLEKKRANKHQLEKKRSLI